MSLVKPTSAQALRRMVGVNTRVTYGTAYWKWDKVLAAVKELRVGVVRDGLYCSPPAAFGAAGWNDAIWSRQEAAGNQGVKLLLGPGNDSVRALDWVQVQRELNVAATRLRPHMAGIEGPNEYEITGDPAWRANLHAFQQGLYQRAKGNPALAAFPVVGPSFASNAAATACGDLSPWLDRGNLHCYQGGVPESAAHLEKERANKAAVSGSKGLYATEWGYHNALKCAPGHPPVSEKAAAPYFVSALLEHRKFGIGISTPFQLIDDVDEPALSASDRHFGLLHTDFTWKPAAHAIRNLIALCGPDGAPVLDPLEVTVSDPAIRTLVLRRADGRYLVALWRNVKVWDEQKRVDLPAPAPLYVNVGLPTATKVDCSIPSVRPDVYPTGFSKGSLSVCVAGDPVVLLIAQ